MSENKDDIVKSKSDGVTLSTSTDLLVKAIIEEESSTKLKDLTHLFKIHMAKKNIIRLIKYYDMIDLVNEQTMRRLENNPDEISNKDLVTFMSTFLTTIEKTTQTLDTIDDTKTELIINNQKNEVNINMGLNKLDRDSKGRVVDAIKSLMSIISESPEKENVIDIEDIDDEEVYEDDDED